jgi:hypothetical protein
MRDEDDSANDNNLRDPESSRDFLPTNSLRKSYTTIPQRQGQALAKKAFVVGNTFIPPNSTL